MTQTGISNLMDEINSGCALRMKKQCVAETVEYRVNIAGVCTRGTWL